jgi:hypothetical protein
MTTASGVRKTVASPDLSALSEAMFRLSADVRYVAIRQAGSLLQTSRDDLSRPSGADSDYFEEAVVNPTLLTLVNQRGAIDCGGTEFVLIRYGSFWELVFGTAEAHLSVGLEPTVDPTTLAYRIRALAAQYGFPPSSR